jgi:hypothetical protein
LAFLGAPKTEALRAWMDASPYTRRLYGARGLPRTRPPAWPPKPLTRVPERVAAFLQEALQLEPSARPTAVSALRHRAFQPAALTPIVAMAKRESRVRHHRRRLHGRERARVLAK